MHVCHVSSEEGLTSLCAMQACTRMGQSSKALAAYVRMRSAPPLSALAPSVHAYVAAMQAACEGKRWKKALGVWADLKASTCQPNGGFSTLVG